MRMPDLERVRALMERVAAEEMLPRFRRLDAADVREKAGPGDLVTIVDEICEARLSEGLRTLLPGSVVVGEEAADADASQVDLLRTDDPVWVIDPVDGTYNYANGVDRFSTIVALCYRGETVAGLIHDPVNGETGTAARGEGAWIGSTRLTVGAGEGGLDTLTGAFSLPPRTSALRPFAEDLRSRLNRHHWLGSAGLDYLWLASGRAQVCVGGTHGRLKPWDHAAGNLMHREAGGYAAMSTGAGYSPLLQSGVLITAPDRQSWDEVRHLMAQHGH